MANQYHSAIRSIIFADSENILQNIDSKYTQGDNWNERFQYAISLPEETYEEKLCKYALLNSVNCDFLTAAETYAKTIISEYFLEREDKSVRIEPLGGVGGGKKYKWRGILFKLADGSMGPYEGSDEAAAKAIGHDLRGATHFFKCSIQGLCTALQTVIDFKGFRMCAQPVLPVSAETLKMGTADGCKTLYYNDQDLIEKTAEAANKLNLKAHSIHGKKMYTGCDVEGHLGRDGNYYLIDFARAFPPECPAAAQHLDPREIGFNAGQKVVYKPPGSKIYYPAEIKEVLPDAQYILSSLHDKCPITANRNELSSAHMSIFWRMLRPEYVKYGGSKIFACLKKRKMGVSSPMRSPSRKLLSESSPSLSASVEDSNRSAKNMKDSAFRLTNMDKNSHRSLKRDFSVEEDLIPEDIEVIIMQHRHSSGQPTADSQEQSFPVGDQKEGHSLASEAEISSSEFKLIHDYSFSGYGYTSQHSYYNESTGNYYADYDTFESHQEGNFQRRSRENSNLYKWWEGVEPRPPPLSSDALSRFAERDPNSHVHNTEVYFATAFLLDKVVPAVAEELLEMSEESFDSTDITDFLHLHGVNVRHMGLLRRQIECNGQQRHVHLRDRLLLEIVGRTLKNLLRESQRLWMKGVTSSEQSMHRLVSRFFNLITGSDPNANDFWNELVVPGIYARFGKVALDDHESQNLQELCQHYEPFLHALIHRLSMDTGVRVKEEAMQQFMEKYPRAAGFRFLRSDIKELVPVVKNMHQVDFSEGMVLSLLADRMRPVGSQKHGESFDNRNYTADRLGSLAYDRFSRANKAIPDDWKTQELLEVAYNARNRFGEKWQRNIGPSEQCWWKQASLDKSGAGKSPFKTKRGSENCINSRSDSFDSRSHSCSTRFRQLLLKPAQNDTCVVA